MTPTGEASTFLTFGENGTAATNPVNGVIVGSDGYLYGTAKGGGLNGAGAVFKVSPNGETTTLGSFTDGRIITRLVEARNKRFYGTLASNLYEATAGGDLKIIANLSLPTDTTERTYNGLTLGNDGYFYGMSNYGDALKISTSGFTKTLHKENNYFYSKALHPTASLVLGNDGYFYGTNTEEGSGQGHVFRLYLNGQIKNVSSAPASTDFNMPFPDTGVIQAPDGGFYGTTSAGPVSPDGSIFQITTTGEWKTLVNFDDTDKMGAIPGGPLLLGHDGNLYGTTLFGGSENLGTFFRVTPAGKFTTLVNFTGENGSHPDGTLIQDDLDNIYGTVSKGGDFHEGAIYQLALKTGLTQVITFSTVETAKVGQTVVLKATSTSGLPITYQIASGSATLAGNRIIFTKAGRVQVRATQPGDINFRTARNVAVNILVK